MERDRLLRRIEEKYGSLEKPRFDFVGTEYEKDTYVSLRAGISRIAQLEDLTDVNDDVSFSYRVKEPDGGVLWLRVSMVGPYFILVKYDSPGARGRLVEPSPEMKGTEKQIFDMCVEAGLEPIDRETCERPIRMLMFKTEPERVRIFNALFTDSDLLPWE